MTLPFNKTTPGGKHISHISPGVHPSLGDHPFPHGPYHKNYALSRLGLRRRNGTLSRPRNYIDLVHHHMSTILSRHRNQSWPRIDLHHRNITLSRHRNHTLSRHRNDHTLSRLDQQHSDRKSSRINPLPGNGISPNVIPKYDKHDGEPRGVPRVDPYQGKHIVPRIDLPAYQAKHITPRSDMMVESRAKTTKTQHPTTKGTGFIPDNPPLPRRQDSKWRSRTVSSATYCNFNIGSSECWWGKVYDCQHYQTSILLSRSE